MARSSRTLLSDVMTRPGYLPERVIVKAAAGEAVVDNSCDNPLATPFTTDGSLSGGYVDGSDIGSQENRHLRGIIALPSTGTYDLYNRGGDENYTFGGSKEIDVTVDYQYGDTSGELPIGGNIYIFVEGEPNCYTRYFIIQED